MANNRIETEQATQPSASDLFPNLWEPRIFAGFLFTSVCIALGVAAARWSLSPNPTAAIAITLVLIIVIAGTWVLCLQSLTPKMRELPIARLHALAWLLLMGIATAALGVLRLLMNAELVPGQFDFMPALLLTAAVGGLALRYFHIHASWKINLERGQRAYSQALAARIRPHFLFNTLNTIAELTRSDAEAAERSVEDLARLYRMGLADIKHRVSVADEIHTAKSYLNIEQYRLGARMQQTWEIDDDLLESELPILTLQPLVENAVYHGIEPCPEGGNLHIQGWVVDRHGFLRVTNPMPEFSRSNRQIGNNIAMENIRQRLEMAFGDEANMRVHKFRNEYQVTLRFPYTGGNH